MKRCWLNGYGFLQESDSLWHRMIMNKYGPDPFQRLFDGGLKGTSRNMWISISLGFPFYLFYFIFILCLKDEMRLIRFIGKIGG